MFNIGVQILNSPDPDVSVDVSHLVTEGNMWMNVFVISSEVIMERE
jgi:hypothetical protein